MLVFFSTQGFSEEPVSACVINCNEAEIKNNTKNQKLVEKVRLKKISKDSLEYNLNHGENLSKMSERTKNSIRENKVKEDNAKEKYSTEKTESYILNSNEDKNTTYTEDNFVNDIIDMIAVGVMSGLIWIGLNFIRLFFMDFLYAKKLIIEKEKKYLSKRKNGYLTAFILGLGIYLISNSGALIYRYFHSYNLVYIVNTLIALQVIWMLYKHYSYNSNLKKQINITSAKNNSNLT